MAVVAVQFLSVFLISAIKAKPTSDHWTAMDLRYDTSYLELIGEVATVSRATCAAKSLSSNATAFGYVKDELRCLLLKVDYRVAHPWTPPPGIAFFLRDEDINPHPCISWCPFCMPILETPMTWSDARAACRPTAYLMEYYDLVEYRCIVMQLQYLRKPTSNLYWVGGRYTTNWRWITYRRILASLWAPGEPNPSNEGCTLFDPGNNYALFSADCSEKHYALCYYD
ncbi:uncharacterized protein LOC124272512 [Haliotis rubra]|uniref:uncharacterized protein LOC124272512 n=1 Tax=Haliotis rubra TaxID=36100 RepID=UPI001EE5F3EC|nr:uncharacterized protein LOC124272512 [Haliotis rubra]